MDTRLNAAECVLDLLSIEDVELDAELIADALDRTGLKFALRRVASREGLEAALELALPDAILADWSLPGFSGLAALDMVQRRCPQVPFVFVSGTIEESAAISAMRRGATDYVYKHQLDLLGPTLQRAMAEASEKRRRKQAEQQALVGIARYDALVASMAYGMLEMDALGKFVWGNPRALDYFGLTMEQCLGDGWQSAFHPDDLIEFQQGMRAAISEAEPRELRCRVRTPEGHLRWLSGKGGVIHDADGNVTGWVVSVSDITEEKTTRDALVANEQRLALALCTAGAATFDWHVGMPEIAVSDECYAMFDLAPGDGMVAREVIEGLIHPAERDAYLQELRAFIADVQRPELEVEYQARANDRSWHWFLGRSMKVEHDGQGQATRIIFVVLDITARKHSEQERTHLAAMYLTLSRVNQAIVHLTDAASLFNSVSETIVESGKFELAWFAVRVADGHTSPHAVSGRAALMLSEPAMLAAMADPDSIAPFALAIDASTAIVVSDIADGDNGASIKALWQRYGIRSCVCVPVRGGGVRSALCVGSADPDYFDTALVDLLREVAGDISFALDNFERERQRLAALERISVSLEETLKVVARTLEIRDPYTAGHQRRVAALALAIGQVMGLDADCLHGLYLGGLVHDIGKISVPSDLLSKPSRLNEMEYGLIKMHAQAGYDLLKDVDFPWPIARMVWEHHERLDGSGYPRGLRGDAILLEARIIAVADIMEAMASHRPYRAGRGNEPALAELLSLRGNALDAAAVDACVTLFREQNYQLEGALAPP
jgi:PAS domain S-box-containing protein